MDKETKKRTATAATIATVAAGSLLVSNLVSSPGELAQDVPDAPPAIIEQMGPPSGDGDNDGDDFLEETEEDKKNVRERARAWILRLPLGVRLLAGVPMWCLGWLLSAAFSTLWNGFLSPVAGTVAGWLGAALLLLIAYAATAKTVFPDVPLKKIVNRRSIAAILIGVCLLGLADTILPRIWDGYQDLARLVRLSGTFLLLMLCAWRFGHKETKKRAARAAAAAARETAPPTQEDALRRAREMVDSVSG